jgi:hypothetical protein
MPREAPRIQPYSAEYAYKYIIYKSNLFALLATGPTSPSISSSKPQHRLYHFVSNWILKYTCQNGGWRLRYLDFYSLPFTKTASNDNW